jgi:hypothetical protein
VAKGALACLSWQSLWSVRWLIPPLPFSLKDKRLVQFRENLSRLVLSKSIQMAPLFLYHADLEWCCCDHSVWKDADPYPSGSFQPSPHYTAHSFHGFTLTFGPPSKTFTPYPPNSNFVRSERTPSTSALLVFSVLGTIRVEHYLSFLHHFLLFYCFILLHFFVLLPQRRTLSPSQGFTPSPSSQSPRMGSPPVLTSNPAPSLPPPLKLPLTPSFD